MRNQGEKVHTQCKNGTLEETSKKTQRKLPNIILDSCKLNEFSGGKFKFLMKILNRDEDFGERNPVSGDSKKRGKFESYLLFGYLCFCFHSSSKFSLKSNLI